MYGKITSFPKKEISYAKWRDDEMFGQIARNACVAESTAEIYVIDKIASDVGKDLHHRPIQELEIEDESFEEI